MYSSDLLMRFFHYVLLSHTIVKKAPSTLLSFYPTLEFFKQIPVNAIRGFFSKNANCIISYEILFYRFMIAN